MQSLLADIAAARAPTPGAGDPPRALRDAVLQHLRELCGTPRGSVMLAPSYGVEDATRVFHEYPGSVDAIRRDLEAAIRRYEPRLKSATVLHIPSDEIELVLRFEIHGVVVADGRATPVRFTSSLNSDNRVEVR